MLFRSAVARSPRLDGDDDGPDLDPDTDQDDTQSTPVQQDQAESGNDEATTETSGGSK